MHLLGLRITICLKTSDVLGRLLVNKKRSILVILISTIYWIIAGLIVSDNFIQLKCPVRAPGLLE